MAVQPSPDRSTSGKGDPTLECGEWGNGSRLWGKRDIAVHLPVLFSKGRRYLL
jgi:hypothetical protein